MIKKFLGKIIHADIALSENGRCGLLFEFASGSTGVCSFEESPTSDRVRQLLEEAKVNSIAKLEGVPVEVTISSDKFESFRILTEVL